MKSKNRKRAIYAQAATSNRQLKHIGSNFDDFLREEGIFEAVQGAALKKMKLLNLSRWDVVDHLQSEEEVAGYLEACRAENDPVLMEAALEDAKRARQKRRQAR